MRCVVSAPYGVDLATLYRILEELDLSVVSASDFGAGATLADAELDGVDCAVAVLAPDSYGRPAPMATTYIEIGVFLGRGLPLLVIADRSIEIGPALADINLVSTEIDNAEALELHVDLFVKGLEHGEPPPIDGPELPAPDLDRYQIYFDRLREEYNTTQGYEHARRLEEGVANLLRDCGAVIQERSDETGDSGVDIAAYIPGRERSLGLLVVEIKGGRPSVKAYSMAQRQLSFSVINRRSGLGLLLYENPLAETQELRSVPMVVALSIPEFMERLRSEPLDRVLVELRNQAIHGL